jgi:uncharacterized protein (DUF58 family)
MFEWLASPGRRSQDANESSVAAQRFDPVRVTLADLVRLAPMARQLELWQERREIEDGGNHHSVFKGRGMEFAETRPYQAGDDIRHIDWRVTARSGRAHTKLFREERERPVLLWVDLRSSMFFATRGMFKSALAARLAAVIAWIAHTHGDCTGGRILSTSDEFVLAPERGRGSVLRLLRALERACDWPRELTDGIDGRESLQSLCRSVRPGTAVFLISDFAGLARALPNVLSRLAPHSSVTMIHVHDPLESRLPSAGLFPVTSAAGESLLIDCGDAGVPLAHRQQFEQHARQLATEAKRHQTRLITVSTTDDPVEALRGAARPRQRRRRSA